MDENNSINTANDTVVKSENLGIVYNLHHKKRSTLRETLFEIVKGKGKRKYEEFWALKDVSFEIKKKEIFGVIGRNGAGKSTLLKVLSRIFLPDRGSLDMEGTVSPLLTLGCGFVPDLTGRDNIYLNGLYLGLREKEIAEKYDNIVSFSELGEFIDVPVKKYSSGMTARLGFSIAMNIDPDILLIDEVLAVGDEKFKKKCVDKMNLLMEKANAIVIVSHSMETIRTFCTKAMWLRDGGIGYIGDPVETVREYLTYLEKDKKQLDRKV